MHSMPRVLAYLATSAFLIAPTLARAHGDADESALKGPRTHGANDTGPADELDVEPGVAPPQGYHLARRVRKGAIIGGALLFVPTYGLAVARAFGSDCDGCTGARQHRLFAPIIGPFWYALGCGDACGSQAVWIADGVLQLAGAAMIAYGLVPHTVWALDSTTEVALAPMIGAGNQGISIVGRF